MTITIITTAISIATAADHTIIAAVSGKRIVVTSIVFTVGGDVNVTLKDGTTALSGAMDFGGTSEPRGMVVNFGDIVMRLSVGNAFIITLSAAVQVSGFVVYYVE